MVVTVVEGGVVVVVEGGVVVVVDEVTPPTPTPTPTVVFFGEDRGQ
mgnify:CR=1 FL=1